MAGISTLGQALEQIQRIKDQQLQFAELSLQITSGKKTQAFHGLGDDVLLSQRTRADFKSLETYIDNIKNADRRIKLMTGSIAQFKKQAQIFLDALTLFSQSPDHQLGDTVYYDDPLTPEEEQIAVGKTSGSPDADLASLRQIADHVYGFMSDLLNTKDVERFVFGGAEALTQPITDTGTLDSAISSLISQWKNGGITTDNFIADFADRTATGGNPDALTDTIVGYSAALSAGNAGKVFVRVQANAEIEYTALANDQAFRDVIVALAYFKNDDLTPVADVYTPPNAYPGVPDAEGAPGNTVQEMKENFYEVFNALTGMVQRAVVRMDQVSATLDNSRARISEIKSAQQQEQNVLLTTVSDVEDIDINEAAVRVTQLQTQIQASLAVTAKLQELSLVNFLFAT